MGANNQPIHIKKFLQEEWQVTPIYSFTNLKDPYYGSNFKIISNKLNRSIEVQKYDLIFNNSCQFEIYEEVYRWRTSNRFFVSPKHLAELDQKSLCTSFYYAAIYIERVPIRMYEIRDITLDEGLYILYAALQGFQKLYQKYGYFQIQSDLICFTKDGYVKTWINKNLSKIYPESLSKDDKNNKTLSQFIKKLINITEKIIDFNGNLTITEYIKQKQLPYTFENIYQILKLYKQQYKISVSRYLSTVRTLCTDHQKKYQKKNQSTNLFNQSNISKNILKSKTYLSELSNSNAQSQKMIKKHISFFGESLSKQPTRSIIKKQLELNFTKPHKQSYQLNTSRPRVNFNYVKTQPFSPKNQSVYFNNSKRSQINRSISFTSSKDQNMNGLQYNFKRTSNCYFTANQQFQIDPDIAADLDQIQQ